MTVRMICLTAGVATLGLWSAGSSAQIRPYGVIEAGVERRKILTDVERIAPIAGIEGPGNHKDGFAYGVGIGAEALVSSALFVGVEASASRSEADTVAEQFRGIQLSPGLLIGVNERTAIHPRWSYAATARGGVNVTRSVALFGLFGVGGERVRRDFDSGNNGLAFASTLRTNQKFDSFTYGGGVRLFLTDRVGVRLEYRRVDADSSYRPQRLTAGAIFRL